MSTRIVRFNLTFPQPRTTNRHESGDLFIKIKEITVDFTPRTLVIEDEKEQIQKKENKDPEQMEKVLSLSLQRSFRISSPHIQQQRISNPIFYAIKWKRIDWVRSIFVPIFKKGQKQNAQTTE